MRTKLTLALLLVLANSMGAQTPSIRTGTQIVIVDVTVSDAHGNPIHGLKASDFNVTEDKAPQTIARFEEHVAPPLSAAVPLGASLKLDPGVFTNYSPAPTDRPVSVILLDMLNTPRTDQVYVRDQLLSFMKTLQPGTPVAIFGLTTRLILLQGYSSDPAVLRTALEHKKATPQESPLLPAPIGSETIMNMGEEVSANVQAFESTINASQNQIRTLTTLSAMNDLARYLSFFPGRKNVIWFSGAFPINLLPMADDPTTAQFTASEEFRQTTDLLTRSQVAIYPVDARGLFGPPMIDASNSGSRYVRNPQQMGKDLARFNAQTADEHITMNMMAEATGGKAFFNTNNLRGAVQNAIESGSNFYTLVYAPTNKDWNNRLRKIQVTTSRSGLQLSYRRGYYAVPPAALDISGKPKDTSVSPMRSAMLRGGPTPTEIVFKVQVVAAPETTDTPSPGTSLAPETKGPFRRYVVNFVALPGDVSIPPGANGNHAMTMQFVTIAYDADGKALASINSPASASLKPQDYARILQEGVKYTQVITVPVRKGLFLRMGLHDLIGNKVGAVEVPLSAVPEPSH